MARKDSKRSSTSGSDGLPSIDGFTVEEPIGEGGFSQVYRGTQETPARDAAIKVFRTSGKVGARVRERFKRESDVIGALSSEDGLVTVFTGGFTGSGAPYLAMELCEGGSIADRIRAAGPLPVDEVLAVGERIGSALAVVHSQNVAHRDVKPSNILLKADGRAMLTDFGLSVVGEMTEALGEESRLAMTEVYAPPERLNPTEEGGGVDAAGDQYSFALSLYAMLLGGSPFTGETTTQRALKALRGHIEPLARADVPPQLVGVLRRAMAAQPHERWPSMVEFVGALRSSDTGAQAPQPRVVPTEPSTPPPPLKSGGPSPQPSVRQQGNPTEAPQAIQPPEPMARPVAAAPAAPGLSGGMADAPTAMPGVAPQDSVPSPSSVPARPPAGLPPVGPAVTSELADEATRMPQRDAGIPVIEAPPEPEPEVNPKRKFYVAGAIAASAVLVVVIGALVQGRGPGPDLDPDPGPDPTEVAQDSVVLELPTVDSVKRTDDGLAFTWTGEPGVDAFPVYKVEVDGDESGQSEGLDGEPGEWAREQFVSSVTMGDGTVHQVDAEQHEYCVEVQLIATDPDGVESVTSEPKCL